MNETVTINMENLSKEEREQFMRLVEKGNKKKSKVWEPADRDKYYYVRSDGEVLHGYYEKCCSFDCSIYSIGNCFRTEEEAKFVAEKIKVIAELKRFAEENNKQMDWNNEKQDKYYLRYNYNCNKIFVDNNQFLKCTTIYFSSEEIAKKAIETIGEERLKKYYFEIEE